MFDVAIIGGSAAGLSAGLILGRFKRKVLICDSGKPRNAVAEGVHGFLSRDGTPPQELFQISREQLKPYTTVDLRQGEVIDVVRVDDHFDVIFSDVARQQAKYILLATGVKDELPAIKGLADFWGKGVFHCPYCHGWEVRDTALALIANGNQATHISKLLLALTDDLVICTNGPSTIEDDDQKRLAAHGVRIITTPIAEIKGTGESLQGIAFEDGSYLAREAIFTATTPYLHSDLSTKLGCELDDAGRIQVDEYGLTSVEGVYAAGDITTPMQQVIHAASSGAKTAAMINAQLAEEAFAVQPVS